jgi:Ran GTPase-activating protein (RanGAP) involved in mRNA processing and transport
MVLIDGHDSAWQRKFHTAAAAVRNNSECLTSIPNFSVNRNNKFAYNNGEEGKDRKRKIVFMHLNLGHVPWEKLLLRPNQSNELNLKLKDRFLAIEVIDCTGLEIGLPIILQLPLQRLKVSTDVVVTKGMGRVLCNGLRESSWTLQQFQMSNGAFSPAAMDEFANGLAVGTSLQELNLSHCTFRIHDNDTTMAVYKYRTNNVKKEENRNAERCIAHLARGIARSSIFCLKMTTCKLQDHQIAILIQHGVMCSAHMQELCLGGNDLKAEALVALGTYIGSSGCPLVKLELSNSFRDRQDSASSSSNHVREEDTLIGYQSEKRREHMLSWLYPALAINTSLRILHLASNGLKDEDIPPLCYAVSHSQVTMLDLKSNCITNYGAQILAEHLPPKLERLWLLGNPLGIEGARALKQELEHTHVNLIDLRIPIYNSFELIPELEKIQEECYYFLLLNKGGRRILVEEQYDNDLPSWSARNMTNDRPLKVPLGLWALVLERVNRIDLGVPWCRAPAFQCAETNRAEVMYHLLKHGTMLRQHR